MSSIVALALVRRLDPCCSEQSSRFCNVSGHVKAYLQNYMAIK